MAAYGTPDVAIAGELYGMKADVDSAIAQEDIAFGSPVFGPVGVENKAYGPHKDKATETLDADLVASNVLTTTINGTAVASTYATSHAATMTAHIAAINGRHKQILECIIAEAASFYVKDAFGNTPLDYLELLHHDNHEYEYFIKIRQQLET